MAPKVKKKVLGQCVYGRDRRDVAQHDMVVPEGFSDWRPAAKRPLLGWLEDRGRKQGINSSYRKQNQETLDFYCRNMQ